VVRDRISSQRLRVDARSLPSGFGSLLCQLCTTEHRFGSIAGRFGSKERCLGSDGRSASGDRELSGLGAGHTGLTVYRGLFFMEARLLPVVDGLVSVGDCLLEIDNLLFPIRFMLYTWLDVL
jgi:hypothetical protein